MWNETRWLICGALKARSRGLCPRRGQKKGKEASVARVAIALYIVLTGGAYGLFEIHIKCAHGWKEGNWVWISCLNASVPCAHFLWYLHMEIQWLFLAHWTHLIGRKLCQSSIMWSGGRLVPALFTGSLFFYDATQIHAHVFLFKNAESGKETQNGWWIHQGMNEADLHPRSSAFHVGHSFRICLTVSANGSSTSEFQSP